MNTVKENGRTRPLPGCPQVSFAESMALSCLMLLPVALMLAAAHAAGVPAFADVETWLTFTGSCAIATVVCLYRPGCVAGMWVFCAVMLSVTGAAGGLLWAAFPAGGYDITLTLSFIAFCAMACPVLASVHHQY